MGCWDLSGLFAAMLGHLILAITLVIHIVLFITSKIKKKKLTILRFIYPAYIFALFSYISAHYIYKMAIGLVNQGCSGASGFEYLIVIAIYSGITIGIVELIRYMKKLKIKSKK